MSPSCVQGTFSCLELYLYGTRLLAWATSKSLTRSDSSPLWLQETVRDTEGVSRPVQEEPDGLQARQDQHHRQIRQDWCLQVELELATIYCCFLRCDEKQNSWFFFSLTDTLKQEIYHVYQTWKFSSKCYNQYNQFTAVKPSLCTVQVCERFPDKSDRALLELDHILVLRILLPLMAFLCRHLVFDSHGPR